MPKYIKKPQPVEAIQFKGDFIQDKELISKITGPYSYYPTRNELTITTLHGKCNVRPGEYVIFGPHDCYPCAEHVLLATYDQVMEA